MYNIFPVCLHAEKEEGNEMMTVNYFYHILNKHHNSNAVWFMSTKQRFLTPHEQGSLIGFIDLRFVLVYTKAIKICINFIL